MLLCLLLVASVVLLATNAYMPLVLVGGVAFARKSRGSPVSLSLLCAVTGFFVGASSCNAYAVAGVVALAMSSCETR